MRLTSLLLLSLLLAAPLRRRRPRNLLAPFSSRPLSLSGADSGHQQLLRPEQRAISPAKTTTSATRFALTSLSAMTTTRRNSPVALLADRANRAPKAFAPKARLVPAD